MMSETSDTGLNQLPVWQRHAGWETIANERLERVAAWGGASAGMSHVFRPTTIAQLRQVFDLARTSGRSVGLRGGGNSYGDAALNDEQLLVDLRRMDRILAWDPQSGQITVEPGVTLERLFAYIIEDGWWPPVSTGTMKITIGGGAGMNVHGKNAYRLGTNGDHISEFDLLLPNGEIITCSRSANSDIFHAAIGGFGMLGCFTSLTMKMKRIYSGYLDVEALTRPNLRGMLDYLEAHQDDSDYLVGWIDSFKGGKGVGRGEIHRANYLPPEADPAPAQSLRLDHQHLPPNLFGIVPKSMLWLFMRPFVNNAGWRLVNAAKYWAGALKGETSYRQTHTAFHFLLDYVPDWKRSYGPQGLIQYQCFLPRETAHDALADVLRLGLRRRLPNYLSVLKRHRPDPFLLTHGLDGFSLAMDFRVTRRNRPRLVALAREMDEIVLAAGGRFYFAKDSTLTPQAAAAFLGEEALAQFRALKRRCDPEGILQTNLWRRLFVPQATT